MGTAIIEVAMAVAVGGMLVSAIRRFRAGAIEVPECEGCGHATSRAYPRCRRCGVDVGRSERPDSQR